MELLDRKTALFLAVENGCFDILIFLLAHKVDINSLDTTGKTALNINLEMVKLFLMIDPSLKQFIANKTSFFNSKGTVSPKATTQTSNKKTF